MKKMVVREENGCSSRFSNAIIVAAVTVWFSGSRKNDWWCSPISWCITKVYGQ